VKATKKTLKIEIEYFDKTELNKIFRSIQDQVSTGNTNNFVSNESNYIYQWHIDFDITNDFREEQINGKWCRIYKSRLNE
jgi:hypothetical protein